jgi:hypothetical protein
MSHHVPAACLDLAERQGGVISRRQALAGGLPADVIDRLLRSGRWRPLH